MSLRRLRDWVSAHIRQLFKETSPADAYAAGAMPVSISEAKRLVDTHRLAELLPYEAYDEQTGLFYAEDSVGFLLEVAPATALGEAQIKVLTGLFTQGLKEGTGIQVMLYASPDIHPKLQRWADARTSGGIFRELAKKRLDYLQHGNWQSLLSGQPMLLRNFRLFLSVTRPLGVATHGGADPEEAAWLRRTRASFLGILQSAGMPAIDMDAGGLVNLLDTILNPKDRPRRHLDWDGRHLLREQAVDPDTVLMVGRDSLGLVHEGHEVEVIPFSVRQFPTAWPAWRMGDLIGDLFSNTLRYTGPFIASVTVDVPDPMGAAGNAKMKAARATQMADSPVGKFLPQWRERKQEWEFVDRMLSAGHKILDTHFQLVLFTRQGDAEQACQRAQALFESQGWVLSRDRFITLHAFLSALPLMSGPAWHGEMRRMGRFRTFLTWSTINTLPLVGEWQGTATPLLQLVGRRGQLMYLDPFDNEKGNYNVAVAATSGAGKSFFTQEMVASTLGTGGRCWVIDSGRSYEQLCTLVGGTFLEFSESAHIRLNPFTWVARMDMEMPLLKDLLALMASPNKPLDSAQMSDLETAIKQVWQASGNDADITAVAAWLSASADQSAKEVGKMLYPYTREGTYGAIFDGKANVDLDNAFVVLELGELDAKPDLQRVVLLILMMRITEAMYLGDRRQRKLCIIDEAWRLMGSGNAGDFIMRGYRTARKFGGAFMTITQGIDDYYSSNTAKVALANSDWKFLMRQSPESIAAAQRQGQMMMDDSLKELLLSIDTQAGQYSEIAILGPGGTAVGRLIVDPFTEKLYSTKAQEVQAIRDMQVRGLSLTQAVGQLVAQSRKR